MASAVINMASTGTYCHHCKEVNHRLQDCALLTVDPALDSSTRARDHRPHPQSGAIGTWPVYCPNPYDRAIEVCHHFNHGQCSDTMSCKFRHIYSESGQILRHEFKILNCKAWLQRVAHAAIVETVDVVLSIKFLCR